MLRLAARAAFFDGSVFAEIGESLIGGRTVKISSFGSFYVREKGERMGRNPKTGDPVEVLS